MSNDSPASVAAAYFSAWTRNDIEQVQPLLHPDVTFVGALGSTQATGDTLAGLRGMFAMTDRVEVIKRSVDGADVLTWFELRTARLSCRPTCWRSRRRSRRSLAEVLA